MGPPTSVAQTAAESCSSGWCSYQDMARRVRADSEASASMSLAWRGWLQSRRQLRRRGLRRGTLKLNQEGVGRGEKKVTHNKGGNI